MNKIGAIDIGNTRIKAGTFDSNGQLTDIYESQKMDDIVKWLEKHEVQEVIVSDVNGAVGLKEPTFKVIVLDSKLRLPFNNLYQTPHTLGADRIAAMSAVSSLFPGKASLVFDIGTCMTIDLLHPGNEYRGGNISPGINMRLQAMHNYTKKLPLSNAGLADYTMGKDTLSALANGALKGMLNEIEGYIVETMLLYPELNIVLCGGDAHYFDKQLKYKIFADQNLVLYGLYHLLVFND